MIISYFVLVVPFLFAGAALSLIFMGHGKNIFRLYFADLCASAIAAILFGVLLLPLGGYNFALALRRRRRVRLRVAGAKCGHQSVCGDSAGAESRGRFSILWRQNHMQPPGAL